MQINVQAVSGWLKIILCQNVNGRGIIRGNHAANEAILREVHGRVDMLVREERHLVVAVLLLLCPDQPPAELHVKDDPGGIVASAAESLKELLFHLRTGAVETKQRLEAGCSALFQVRFESTPAINADRD
jgi:hypothetical protein